MEDSCRHQLIEVEYLVQHLAPTRCPLNAALLGERSGQLGFSSLLLASGPSLLISPPSPAWLLSQSDSPRRAHTFGSLWLKG